MSCADSSPVTPQVSPPLPRCTHLLLPKPSVALALQLGCTPGHHPEGVALLPWPKSPERLALD